MWHAWERREKCTTFWSESEKKKDHLKDRVIDGKMGSKWNVRRLVGGGVEWIQLAQERDRWLAVVNTAIDLQVVAPRS
jgi:hypothetical protein